MGLGVTILALSSVLGSASIANAATFNFYFENEDGAVDGAVQGTIELPDGDGSGLAASSIVVTSAPAGLGRTTPFDIFANFTTFFANSFTVVGGMIDFGASEFGAQDNVTFNGNFGLNFPGAGTFFNAAGSNDLFSGVVDSDSSTLADAPPAPASTPESTSMITLIGVGVLGVASKLKKKA